MGYMSHDMCCVIILILFVPVIKAQNTSGVSLLRNEQDRLRCLGVQCPPERPRCVADNRVAKCVASEPISTVGSRDFRSTRLSRPAPGFDSSQRQPSRPSQTFQVSGAERSKSQRNLTPISSFPSSKPVSGGHDKTLGNVPSYCFERFQTGRCRAYFPRYYYNKATGRCHRFVYGGCGGNRNNFKTEQACKSVCLEPVINSGFNVGLDAKHPPPISGSNINTLPNRPNRNTNTGINRRPTNVHSGFAKGAPPPQPNYCKQNPERGPCMSIMPRYYYNKQTGQCRSFLYGGCGGNRNNFMSMAHCKRACDYFDVYTARQSNGRNIPQGPDADILPSGIPVEKFTQEAEPAPSSSFPLSTLSSSPASLSLQASSLPAPSSPLSSSSSQNPFSSQLINNNPPQGTSRFAKGAPPPLPPQCFLTPEAGPCYAYMPRFYYNKEVGECRSFAYGGCGGNGNNFQSMDACKRACDYIDAYTSRQSNGKNIPQDQSADIILATEIPEISFNQAATTTTTTQGPVPEYCLLPKKAGPCRALIPRFFYNSETSRCEQFGFGGCQPNENNFKSERECKRRCLANPKPTEVERISGGRNINGERNTMRSGQLRQFNPVDSAAFREFLMNQQMNNDIDIVGPSVSGFHVCAQRVDRGTCNLEIRSYYFNASTRSCRPFIFRGCGGNQNRFPSRQACHDMCINDSLRPARTP